MNTNPYVLAIASHKGGTGRTTVTIGLARALGARGKRVLLVDGNVTPTLHLFLPKGSENAPIEERQLCDNVFVGTGEPGEAARIGADLILLDCPPVFDRGADAFIGRANGVVLTTLPDPLAIRTIPGATSALKDVLVQFDDLSFLGVLVSIFKDDDPLQLEMLETLRSHLGALCLEPPIPWQREVADWALAAGAEFPDGSASEAFDAIINELASELGVEVVAQETVEEPTTLRLDELGATGDRAPYRLVVASHKGGTGRTTTTLALADAFARLGRRVLLLDGNATKTLHLFTKGGRREIFENVFLGTGQPGEIDELDVDLVLIDAPPIFEEASRSLCREADGVLLTTLPDPLAFRTIPGATRALVEAKKDNERLELLGICVSTIDREDALQQEMFTDLQKRLGEFCLETAIPLQEEITEWGLEGGPVPEGPAKDAYAKLADELADAIFTTSETADDVVETASTVSSETEEAVETREELLSGRSAGHDAAHALDTLRRRCLDRGAAVPYLLALASHKGGTGRTVAAMSLASVLGQRGRKVLLVDARTTKTMRLFQGADTDGEVFENVRIANDVEDIERHADFDPDLVLIDTPPLLEAGCGDVLRASDAVVLTVLPDPLAIRTIPGAIHALREVESSGAVLDLAGVLVNIFRADDPLQAGIWPEIRDQLGALCLGEPIPWQQEISDWAMQPGAEMPSGPVRDAFEGVADRVQQLVFGMPSETRVHADETSANLDELFEPYVLAVSDLSEDEASLTAAALLVAWMTSILEKRVVLVGRSISDTEFSGGLLRCVQAGDADIGDWQGADLVLFDGCGGAEFAELVGRCHCLLEDMRKDCESDAILDLARETLEEAGSGRQVLQILMSLLDRDATDAGDDSIEAAVRASDELVTWAEHLAVGQVETPAVDVLLEILASIERQIDRFEEDWIVSHDVSCRVEPDAARRTLGIDEATSLDVVFDIDVLGTPFEPAGRKLRPREIAPETASVLVQKGILYSEVEEGAFVARRIPDVGRVLKCVSHGNDTLVVALRATMQGRYDDALRCLAPRHRSADASFLAGLICLRLDRPRQAMEFFDRAVAQPVTLGEELGLLGLGLVLHVDCGDGLQAHSGVNPRSASLLRLLASLHPETLSQDETCDPNTSELTNTAAAAARSGELA